MIKEHTQLENRGTWRLVPISSVPKDRRLIPSVWQYKYKFVNGVLVEEKSRGCAGGHKQIAGLDYSESHAPTTRVSNVRVMMAVATQEQHLSEQADVEGAFLIPYLDGEWGKDGLYHPKQKIYMRPFEGFETYDEKTGELMVYLLLKSIYGLVQAALQWNRELVSFFREQHFRQCVTDPCMFIKTGLPPGEYLAVPVLVDDMVPTGKPQQVIDQFLTDLGNRFAIKRLGPTEWFSGILIKRDADHTYLMQHAYAGQLIRRWDMHAANPATMPIQPGEDMYKLTHDDEDPILHDKTEVCSLASGIGWLVECTRLDLLFTRMTASRMQQKCTESSWKLMKNILRYIQHTQSYGIRYSKDTEFPNTLICFVDASLHTCSVTGRAA